MSKQLNKPGSRPVTKVTKRKVANSGQRGTTNPQMNRSLPRGTLPKAQPGLTKPSRSPYDVLSSSLNQQEQAIANYLHGLATPGYPTKVPIILGSFELETNTYEFSFEGTSVAGAAGVAYVAAAPDGWADTDNVPGGGQIYLKPNGTANGYPVFYSAANATNSPAQNSASDANNGKIQLGILDAGFSAATSYRMTSLILDAWSDAPLQTAQGDLIVAAVCNADALETGVLNNATFNTISQLPPDSVTAVQLPLSGWKSGEVASVCLVPFNELCVTMLQATTAAATTTAGYFGVIAIGSGMASGQTFRWKITMKYETTCVRNYQTNVLRESTVPVELSTLSPYLTALKAGAATSGANGHQMFKGPAALMSAPNHGAPTKIAHAIMAAAKVAKESGVLDIIGSGLKKGASWALGKVPWAGGALQGIFNSIFG